MKKLDLKGGGFEIASTMDYAAAHAELLKTPDGAPGEDVPLFPGGSSTLEPTPANRPEPPPAPVEGEREMSQLGGG